MVQCCDRCRREPIPCRGPRRLAFDAQRLVLPQTSFLDRLAAPPQTQRSRVIDGDAMGATARI